jgi:hypothetical protein
VCTVVVRWAPAEPVRVLALRDELVGRDFDDPEAWWPDVPGAVGGRDRSAGGTWCATHVGTGTTGLVLNRPQRQVADAGAPSRGVLPLLAVQHGEGWAARTELAGMASFSLVLASPEALVCWAYDGEQLRREELGAGTHMVTSGGVEDGKATRHLAAFEAAAFPEGWRTLLRGAEPVDDPTALVVRAERADRVFATVFGQLITARPGSLALSWSREPWTQDAWERREWRARG